MPRIIHRKQKAFENRLPNVRTVLRSWKTAWAKTRPENELTDHNAFGELVFGDTPKGSSSFRNLMGIRTTVSYHLPMKLPEKAILVFDRALSQGGRIPHFHLSHLEALIEIMSEIEPSRMIAVVEKVGDLRMRVEAVPELRDEGRLPALEDRHTFQLPKAANPLVPYFAGRSGKLRELIHACCPESGRAVDVCVITGGKGKTQLAGRLIQEIARVEKLRMKFPGGVTYVNFKSVAPLSDLMNRRDRNLARIMIGILTRARGAVGIRDQDNLELMTHHFADHLRNNFIDRRFLIVVDNVPGSWEMEQLTRCLLHSNSGTGGKSKRNGIGTFVFISAPGRTKKVEKIKGLKPAEIKITSRLSTPEALQVLRARFPSGTGNESLRRKLPKDALEKIANKTMGSLDRIGLAVSMVFHDIQTLGKVRLDRVCQFVEEFEGIGSDEEKLRFEIVIRDLPPVAEKELRVLSFVRGPFKSRHAESLVRAAGLDVQGLRERLIQHYGRTLGFLSADPEGDSYRFVDPSFREALQAKVGGKEAFPVMLTYCKLIAESVRRLEEKRFGIRKAKKRSAPDKAASRMYEIGIDFQARCKDDFVRGFRWAASNAFSDQWGEDARQALSRLLLAAPELLSELLNPQELSDLGKLALEVFEDADDPLEAAHAYAFIADADYRSGLYRGSYEWNGKRVALLKRTLDRMASLGTSGQTAIVKLLVSGLWDRGRCLVWLRAQSGRSFERCMKDFRDAERLATSLFDGPDGSHWRCQNDHQMGWVLMRVGDFENAEDRMFRAKRLAREIGDFNVACRTQIDIGRCWRKHSEKDVEKRERLLHAAKTQTEHAWSFAREIGSPMLIALSRRVLGLICESQGDWTGSIDGYEEAIEHNEAWHAWKSANHHAFPGRSLRQIELLTQKMKRQ